jgi:hypothetical protein
VRFLVASILEIVARGVGGWYRDSMDTDDVEAMESDSRPRLCGCAGCGLDDNEIFSCLAKRALASGDLVSSDSLSLALFWKGDAPESAVATASEDASRFCSWDP